MKQVSLLGVNHISKESITRIQDAIQRLKPDVVCVELDSHRADAIEERQFPKIQLIKHVGVFGYVFAVFGYMIQGFLGGKTGVMPGQEMKEAISIAEKHNIDTAYIDRPIHQTLQRFKQIPWSERFRVFTDMLLRRTPDITFSHKAIPDEEELEPILSFFSEQYPTLAQILIHERDAYMAKKVKHTLQEHDVALVIIGAAHLPGVREHLNT